MRNPKTSAMLHLNKLSGEIGSRAIGTPGNQDAAGYIQDVFTACDLDVEEQDYTCPAWEDLGASLTLNGEPLDVAANAFSPACAVTALLVPACTIAELEAADLNGRIGLLYGDLTTAPLACKSWFLKTERDDQIIRLLEEKEPAALITVQTKAGLLERLIEDWEFLIPSATVPAMTGLALLRQSGSRVHLRINSRQAPGSTANLVGRKPGNNPEKIVLCAHYDTKFDTPGASDNGGGVAVLLALAERFGHKKMHYGLEFVAFTGEEYLPIGDDEYLRRSGDGLDQIVAAINFDGVGSLLGPNTITSIAGSQLFQEHLNRLTAPYPGVAWVPPWPESNHSTFSMRGIPSIAFSSVGAFRLAHMRDDTVEWISGTRLDEAVALTSQIIDSLQDKPLAWGRQQQ